MEKLFNSILTPLLKQTLYSLTLRRNEALSFKVIGKATTDAPQPPILLVHDLISNKKHSDSIGKTLYSMTQRAVVAVDLRNHGDSPHGDSHKYLDQVSDIMELIERLGSRRISLIGHGLGGNTAMCVALTVPDKIAGLVVVDISPVSTSLEYNKYLLQVLIAMKDVNFNNSKTVSEARAVAKEKLENAIISSNFGNNFMNVVLSNIILKKDDTIGWTCNLNVLIDQYKHWVSFPKELKRKNYNGPTLFIGGQLSHLIPPDDVTAIQVLFPKAVLVYVPNARHYVQDDDPKTFLELTISFLKTNDCYST